MTTIAQIARNARDLASVLPSGYAGLVRGPAPVTFGGHSAVDSTVRIQPTDGTAREVARVNRLQLSAAGLSSGTRSALLSREVVSSDEAAVTGTAVDGAELRSFSVSVYQLAAGQRVVSKTVAADAPHGFSGLQEFTVITGQSRNSVRVQTENVTTNRELFDGISTLLNFNEAAGVTARSFVDEEAGTAYLQIQSRETGSRAAFRLADKVNSSFSLGTVVRDLSLITDERALPEENLGGITVAAQDAEYAINDGPRLASPNNELSLFGDTVGVSLAAPTTQTGAATLTVRPNVTEIVTSVKDFIESFNDVFSAIVSGKDATQTPMQRDFAAALEPLRDDLTDVGIRSGKDGILEVDEVELGRAILDGRFDKVSALFAGPSSFAMTVQEVSRDFIGASRFETTKTTGSLVNILA